MASRSRVIVPSTLVPEQGTSVVDEIIANEVAEAEKERGKAATTGEAASSSPDPDGDQEPEVTAVTAGERHTAPSGPLEWFVFDPLNHRTKRQAGEELPPYLAEERERLIARLTKHGQLLPAWVATIESYRDKYPEVAARAEVEDEWPASARFVVLDGNRRLDCITAAGIEEFKYTVNDALLASDDYREAAFDANMTQLKLTCIEVARQIKQFEGAEGKTTHEELAARLNRSRPWVSQHLALLELPPIVQNHIDSRRIPIRQARRITALSTEQIADLAERLRQISEGGKVSGALTTTSAKQGAPRPKTARKMIGRVRTHFGPKEFADIVCEDLPPEHAAAVAQQVIGMLTEDGLNQVRTLLAGSADTAD